METGLPGWRRSADRTGLQANSLVSGNFTGNFAILGLRDTITCQETAALQPLLEQFPTQINSENILRISELFRKNSEFKHPFRNFSAILTGRPQLPNLRVLRFKEPEA